MKQNKANTWVKEHFNRNGNIYLGDFSQGQGYHGFGRMKWFNKGTYKGHWFDGKM